MRNLLDALESIFRTGSLDARVAVAGAPEVRTLGVRFNHMLSQLHTTMVSKAELEVSRNRLQSEVAERRNTQSALDESNQRLQVLAELDELTGLPNRRRFMDIIMQAIPRAARTKTSFAVLFVDLDHFKEVNDTLGHDVGDALLQEVAKRLRASVRAEDTVARMGGDEFTLLLAETAARDDAAIVAQKIMEDFRNPVQAGAHLLFWQASVGIATYPDDGADAMTLLKAADSALYRSKEEGRSRYNFYSADLTVRAMRRAEITRELRMALERNQLSLHYQPQFQVAGGAMVGVEALLRWNHPVWGMVRPDEFIPIAEDSGLILPIGEWVLQTACTQARAWVAAGLRLRVGVNLSVRELSGEDVVASVERNLRGLDPALLEIEITESLAMKNPDAAALVLTKFRALGVGIAMDDFGTGHSSLSRIKNLPLDRLKIDRSFVHTIGETEDGAELAHAVISIGRALKLRIIAEGIENAEQLEFLCNVGCEEYQGYYGGRPMPAESITQLLM
jgi:diguanylate cyclase (GGDEF)-like protein